MDPMEINLIDPGLPKSTMMAYLNELPIQETTIRETRDVKIISHENARRPDPRWNSPYRVLLTPFLVYMALTSAPTRDLFEIWSQREDQWRKEEIPKIPTDKASLRIQVWAKKLPNPHIHAEQVMIRVPWLRTQISGGANQFLNWFIQNSRGAPEIVLAQGATRSRRCQICASNILGFPIGNHHWTKCIFRRLDGIHRLKWMAINTRAFCSRCGSWSTNHIEIDCVPTGHRPCGRCQTPDHQTFQEICPDLMSRTIDEREQDQRAFEAITEHYETCRRLAEAGKLAYRCQSDFPDQQTHDLLLKLRRQGGPQLLRGWCKFGQHLRHFQKIETAMYTTQTEYSGLYSPEVSSAEVTSTPVFDPEDIDSIVIYGMILDHYRFGEFIIRNRKPCEPMFVQPQNRGARAVRRNDPRFQIQKPPSLQALADKSTQGIPTQEVRLHSVRRIVKEAGAPEVPEAIAGAPEVPGAVEAISGQMVKEGVDGPDQGKAEKSEAPEDRPANPTPGKSQRAHSTDGWNPQSDEEPEPIEKSPASSEDGWGHDESKEEPAETEQDPGAKEDAKTDADSEEEQQEPDEIPESQKTEEPKSEFNRATSTWFTFEALTVMTEPEELRLEKKFIAEMKRHCGIHRDTRLITSSQDTLKRIAQRPIPHHFSSIKARIRFLLFSLTGKEHTIDPEAKEYPIMELMDYISYLQGIHRLLEELARNQRSLEFRVTSCWHAAERSPSHQMFHIPNVELFHSMTPLEVLSHSESFWCIFFEEVWNTGCECHRLG